MYEITVPESRGKQEPLRYVLLMRVWLSEVYKVKYNITYSRRDKIKTEKSHHIIIKYGLILYYF